MNLLDLFETAGQDNTIYQVSRAMLDNNPGRSYLRASDDDILRDAARELSRMGMSDIKVRAIMRDPDFAGELIDVLRGPLVREAMKPSDIPPTMRDRLTMRDIEKEKPQGAFRFRVTYPDGSHRDFMDFAAARSAADSERGSLSRLGEDKKIASTGRTERVLKQLRAQYPEAANDMEALLLAFRSGQQQDRRDINRLDSELDSEEAAIDRIEAEIDRIKKRRIAAESLRDREHHVATVTLDDGTVKRVPVTTDEGFRELIQKYFASQGRTVRDIQMDHGVQTEAAKKKPQPTNPELWGRAKSAARSKFDVYPSAYANAWAAKWYKQHGGGWRMGKPKKKD
jgi:hypothetical protein